MFVLFRSVCCLAWLEQQNVTQKIQNVYAIMYYCKFVHPIKYHGAQLLINRRQQQKACYLQGYSKVLA